MDAISTVGPYRILERLGAGGMGVAYLAQDTRLHRRVVLKSVAGDGGWKPEARRQLLHEARAAARLTHPNVAAIYDVLDSPDGIHIVMEYVQGETLAARIRRGPLSVPVTIAIGIQLAGALAKAHEMGVVHRDLKPGNVMVTPDGEVKILDFGLATRLRSAESEPSTESLPSTEHHIAGTPGYLPPEVFRDHPHDERGDLYSLGVVLFEMLIGRRPFPGQDLFGVAAVALAGPTPKLRDLDPALPAGLEAIVAKAMAREPGDRYGSAVEMAAALRAEGAALALTHARTLTARHRASRWLSALPRRPSPPARNALAVGMALAAVAAVGLLRPTGRAADPAGLTANVEALAEYTQGRSFLERGDNKINVDRSITLLQSAIDKEPRFAPAHAALGRAYWLKFVDSHDGEWSDKALWATLESLRLDPADGSAHHSLAVVYTGTGRAEEGLEEVRRAIALEPGNDEAHALLGNILCERGSREQGLAEIEQAIALRPAYWGHHYALGVALFDAGRYPEAVAALRRVTELQPDSARGFQMLGTAYYASGEAEPAIENYRRAIALGADSGAHTNLGVALYAGARFEEARLAFEEAARLAPNLPGLHRNLGDVYRRLGQSAKAQQSYERAVELCAEELEINPRDAAALSRMAVYEAKLGRFLEGERHAEEAVALNPRSGDVLYRRAVVLALAGRVDESLAAMEEALRRGFSPMLASTDEDLGALRERPEFQVSLRDYW